MSDYRTDEETLEQIQRWWRENGTVLLVTVVVVLGGSIGWNWWQAEQEKATGAASALYLQWLEEREQGGASESSEAIAATLREAYPDSAYVALLRFETAANRVAAGDAASARAELQAVLAMDVPASMKDVARVRLARLDLDAGAPAEALAGLDAIAGKERIGAVQELRGDALRALGRIDDARRAYDDAIAAADGERPLIEMKRDDLAAEQPVPAAAEALR
ncbi:MAG TPA: tetratricopeptide repeat protein [Pseudomonadales bacterium]|nr:tetratricopeptide repeat protein [Pseudomonadales bacterium]